MNQDPSLNPVVLSSSPSDGSHARRQRRALRICMVVGYDLSEPGGVKHHALELARSLRARGDDVTTIGPASRPVEGNDVVAFKGVWRTVSNGSHNALGLFVAPWRVWLYFRRQQFDVIHVHEPLLPALAYWAVWATPNTPHVATFHAFGEHRPSALRAAEWMGGLTLSPFIQRGIAVSSAASAYAARVWSRPVTIVPNGVSTEIFSPRANAPSGALRLLFVGRLSDERKGIKWLLESYRLARLRGVNVTLDVVGDGSGTSFPPIEGVTFHGRLPLDQLVGRYRACDVFVAPSTGQESFGIVLLEAMACGKAIICSDIEGYRTTADHEGALLVRPESAGDLAAAIERMASDPARMRRLGMENRVRALAYDWPLVADQVRREYLYAVSRLKASSGARLLAPALVSESSESSPSAVPTP